MTARASPDAGAMFQNAPAGSTLQTFVARLEPTVPSEQLMSAYLRSWRCSGASPRSCATSVAGPSGQTPLRSRGAVRRGTGAPGLASTPPRTTNSSAQSAAAMSSCQEACSPSRWGGVRLSRRDLRGPRAAAQLDGLSLDSRHGASPPSARTTGPSSGAGLEAPPPSLKTRLQ